MNYELAKKLKEAGFLITNKTLIRGGKNLCYREFLPFPTLSELIDACGDGFRSLDNPIEDEWFVEARLPKIEKCKKCGTLLSEPMTISGKTPEEAVAKLWLALKINKNL